MPTLTVSKMLQSFYVTLDISSASSFLPKRTKTKQNPPVRNTRTAATAPASLPHENEAVADPPHTSIPADVSQTPFPENLASGDGPKIPAPETSEAMELDLALFEITEKTPPATEAEPEDRIQIMDLHTANPLISYQNQMYSCQWTSTIGTDLLLSIPDSDFPHAPLREPAPGVSLVAATSIKLFGRPVKIEPRADRTDGEAASREAVSVHESTLPAERNPLPDTATPVKIPLGPAPSRTRLQQASFLERLIAIKAAKGEKDEVTVQTRSQRVLGDEVAQEGTPTKRGRTRGRPNGSRKKNGPRTAKGGLFRDYRPQQWDTEGADIRGGTSVTPERWDQLNVWGKDEIPPTTFITARSSTTPAHQIDQLEGESRSISVNNHLDLGPHPQARQPEQGEAGGNLGPANDLLYVRPAEQSRQPEQIVRGENLPAPNDALDDRPQKQSHQPGQAVEANTLPSTNDAIDGMLQTDSQIEASIGEDSVLDKSAVAEYGHSSGAAITGDVEMEDV